MSKVSMIAEDDEELHEVMQYNLGRTGYQIVSSHTGREVLDRIEQSPPDLLLLDILLPEVDGWQICQFITGHAQLKALPIVIFTALGTHANFFRACSYNVAGFFTKPYATADVLRHIDKVLSKSV